jgi:hypothetical protein
MLRHPSCRSYSTQWSLLLTLSAQEIYIVEGRTFLPRVEYRVDVILIHTTPIVNDTIEDTYGN